MMVVWSADFGVTWDEKDRHRNGELVWQFLRGLRSRSEFVETGGHLYPGMFDVICAAIEPWIPLNRYVVRHGVNAVFGWVGAVYCGRLAGRLFGPWASVLGLVLLAATPRYYADSMNNPKDLPFAAMTVVALYYISTVSPRWPYVSASTAAKIAVALALALNIRVGALLYLGYFGLLVGAFVLAERSFGLRRIADTAGRVLAVVVATLVVGTVFWPWAGGAPLHRPFQALVGAANYPWNGTVLFRGAEYGATELPWYYAPWWFMISLPPVVLAGLLLSVAFVRTREQLAVWAALWGVAVLPITAGIVMGSTLYDGVRHLQFVTPVLVVLAVGGWTGAFAAARTVWQRRGVAAALAAGIGAITVFHVRVHPNQGIYFNALVGGPQGAFSNYDMDYWGNCVLQAVEWGVDLARASGIPVTMSGNPSHLVQLNAERFREVAFTYPHRGRHYLDVKLNRGPIRAVRELARAPALHQVRSPDGAVLCIVVPGPAYGEFEALRRQARTGGPLREADRR
jgi:hypothetical protein